MSPPTQFGATADAGDPLSLSVTTDLEQAWQFCHLLCSIGRPTPVVDLVSQSSLFQASPELVKLLCSIPNSPISLAGNDFYVTLSSSFLSAYDTYARSLGLNPDDVIPQIKNFLDRDSMSRPSFIGRVREIEEEEELQLMPLPKKVRMDSEEMHTSVIVSNSRIMDAQTDNFVTTGNGSMVETLTAMESRASQLRLNQEVPLDLVFDGTYANPMAQSTSAREKEAHEPCVAPMTQLFDLNTVASSSMDFIPIQTVEGNKQEIGSPVRIGVADLSWIPEPEAIITTSADGRHMYGKEESKHNDYPLEAADVNLPEIATVNPPKNTDKNVQKEEIMEKDKDDKNENDQCLKEETLIPLPDPIVIVSSTPSESELRSLNTVPDTEDMPILRQNQNKQEDHTAAVFTAPINEQLLKPSAITMDEAPPLVDKTLDLSKPLENRKTGSPLQKLQNKRKKLKQNEDGISEQLNKNPFPEFDSHVIEEKEGSGGYGIVYRAKRKSDGTKVAIKCPHADAQKLYVDNERRMLERFGGKNFVIKYEGCLKSGESDCFMLEHVEHDRPELLKREIDVNQLQWYGYCMFRALASLHKQGVVHRDVKPGNFLFSRRANKGYLIDFNLAMDLHQKYLRTDKNKMGSSGISNHTASQYPKSGHPTAIKKYQTSIKSQNITNRMMNKAPLTTLAPNSLKKAAGKMKAKNEMGRWDRLNSQGGDGSGVTSTRNNVSGDKKREPLPCHGRKELISFLQETMSGSKHEASRAPASMRKRVNALPGKPQKELLYLTPMPLRSNNLPVPGAGLTPKEGLVQKRDGACAGTKGFRAPEVCMRSSHQGTKIDVWSAGVTLLYLMIGRSPFTGDPDQNMKEIMTLRGNEDLWEVAKLHNRESSLPLDVYEAKYMEGMELREWCRHNTKRKEFLNAIPRSLFDLVDKCLVVNPRLRISAEDALQHDFFRSVQDCLQKQRLFRRQNQPQTQTQTQTQEFGEEAGQVGVMAQQKQ